MNQITYREMTLEDVDQVAEIELATFPTPWSRESFYTEIKDNKIAKYIVAVKQNKIVGYGGLWHVFDEMHITNVAVIKEHRGLGIGNGLVCKLIDMAERDELVSSIALEVRRSNFRAQSLYRKYGFIVIGVRERYYEDNREDAYIMQKDIQRGSSDENDN